MASEASAVSIDTRFVCGYFVAVLSEAPLVLINFAVVPIDVVFSM